jgi:hypothetical protein
LKKTTPLGSASPLRPQPNNQKFLAILDFPYPPQVA